MGSKMFPLFNSLTLWAPPARATSRGGGGPSRGLAPPPWDAGGPHGTQAVPPRSTYLGKLWRGVLVLFLIVDEVVTLGWSQVYAGCMSALCVGGKRHPRRSAAQWHPMATPPQWSLLGKRKNSNDGQISFSPPRLLGPHPFLRRLSGCFPFAVLGSGSE